MISVGRKSWGAKLGRFFLICVVVSVLISCDSFTSKQDAASKDTGNTEQPKTEEPQTSAPEEGADTVVSAPPLEATTAEQTVASESPGKTTSVPFPEISGRSEDLFYGNNYSGPYRIYLRYEDYLGRDDIPSVYMGVAVQDSGMYNSSFTSAVFRYLVNEYDFVLFSLYDDRTGEYLGPSTYTRNPEVAEAYEDFLYEHADEFAQASKDQSPRGIEVSEEDFKDLVITAYEYTSYHVQTSYLAPDVPPWTYSDSNVEVLGNAPGQNSRSSAPPESTASATPEATASGSYGQSTEELEAEAEEAAGDYYRAAGSEDWAYTYEHLDSETQNLFTREEWFQKNEWFADNGSVIYHIESVERLGTSSGLVVGVTLRLTYEDGSSSTRTTYFVYEDGVWKHRFGQEENDLFMPDLSYEEFVQAQG